MLYIAKTGTFIKGQVRLFESFERCSWRQEGNVDLFYLSFYILLTVSFCMMVHLGRYGESLKSCF